MDFAGLISLLVVIGIVVAIYYGFKDTVAPASYDYCSAPKITRPVTGLFSCPDPNGACSAELANMEQSLALVLGGEGGLLESSQLDFCEETYCAHVSAYMKCKCSQCYNTGGWDEDVDCVNQCSWGSEAICQSYVNCAELIDA
jgi:hypothetical protein